ncbi:MAG: hypothetical protein EH225_11320 [Calditrichaeota bacterium]|nr:hypothetical protein [Calditrichota bacterium]RQV99591.1 MAG: hypothetical protein EH225_11320 [Calditrichota bacterium]
MDKYKFVIILCAMALVFIVNTTSFSQENQGNAFVVTVMELAMPEDGSVAEFDSLNQLYTDKVIKKNNLILSHRNLRHWWGNDNREFVVIYEVASWGDILKANEMNNTLFEEAWITEETRKEFNHAYNKYFTGKHSDEIYQELNSGRK